MADSSASQSSASDSFLLVNLTSHWILIKKTILWTEDSSLEKLSTILVSQWPFLHYNEAQDLVFCHTCLLGFKKNKMRAAKVDPAFVSLYWTAAETDVAST